MNTSKYEQNSPPDNQPPPSGNLSLDDHDEGHLLAYQRRNARILWALLAALLIMAAGVFFVLPNYVGSPQLSTEPLPINETGSPAVRSEASGGAISPFGEAQLMRARQAAQATLEQLLAQLENLEQHGVVQWANEPYEEALASAEAGDNAYREQDFITADEHYQESLATLEALEASMPQVVEQQLENGYQAIRDGQSAAARAAFELAMLIAPGSVEADAGLQRAQVLDEVLALNAEAGALRDRGDLEAARERYREALTRDSEHTGTQDRLTALESAIEERDFTRLMSQGYGALAANEAQQAEGFFQQALAVRPDSGEANSALEQVRDRMTSNAINRHLETARGHEQAEAWQQALAAYQQALEVDANVVAATEGLRRARSRGNLDDFMKRLLADPLQLVDEAVYEESRDIYLNALRIPDAGPTLRKQLDEAKYYLEQARIPREVTLRSDGMTQVAILRVQRLGQFSNTTLSLTPGRYVATGSRSGYRDVRQEFVVPFEESPPEVTVICAESIR